MTAWPWVTLHYPYLSGSCDDLLLTPRVDQLRFDLCNHQPENAVSFYREKSRISYPLQLQSESRLLFYYQYFPMALINDGVKYAPIPAASLVTNIQLAHD